MKLGWTSFKQLRYLKRYRRIFRVMIKYGFAQVLDKLRLYGLWERILFRDRRNEALPHRLEIRLRLALEELGPAFVKIGQLLSTRSDLLPASYTTELARLQDNVAPFPFDMVQRILVEEFNPAERARIKFLDPEPLAAASIGQVHRAFLDSGEAVVIKFKRPDIEGLIKQDLEILIQLADLVERKTSLGPVYQFSRIASEIRQIILRELDYYAEARNAQRFRLNFSDNPHVHIPRVYWKYTTRDVLMLEYRQGISIKRYLQDPDPDFPGPRIAAALTDTFFKQVFIDGFFHGDPHPGNIAVLPDGRLFFMDFGSAGYISEELRGRFTVIFRAFQAGDTAALVDELLTFSFTPPVVNRQDLIRDINGIQEQYYDLPLQNINLTEALQEMMQVASKHHLRFPYEFLLLVKALVSLEGTVGRLDPDFSVAGALQKYGPALKKRHLRVMLRRTRGTLRGYQRLLEEIPERTVEILRETASGELKIKIEITQTEPIVQNIKQMLNRLALSIVLAGLVIGLTQSIRIGPVPWLQQIPLGEITLIGAAAAALWWLFAFIRS